MSCHSLAPPDALPIFASTGGFASIRQPPGAAIQNNRRARADNASNELLRQLRHRGGGSRRPAAVLRMLVAEADRQPVPDVDHADGDREGDELIVGELAARLLVDIDRKSTRLNSSHSCAS